MYLEQGICLKIRRGKKEGKITTLNYTNATESREMAIFSVVLLHENYIFLHLRKKALIFGSRKFQKTSV